MQKKHTPQRRKVKVEVPGKKRAVILTHDTEDATELGGSLLRLALIAEAVIAASELPASLPDDATEEQARLACAGAFANLQEWLALECYPEGMGQMVTDINTVKSLMVQSNPDSAPRPAGSADPVAQPEDSPSATQAKADRIEPPASRTFTGEQLTGAVYGPGTASGKRGH